MKQITIEKNDILSDFATPPENSGQIVTVDYACTEQYILERTRDASNGTESVVAYRWPEAGEFAPWNESPKLGRHVGVAVIR